MLDRQKLKFLESEFLKRYPQGFKDPAMQEILKKHPIEKMTAMAHEVFKKSAFNKPDDIVSNMATMVGRSSMVSMFEKPKFRDFVKSLNSHDKAFLAKALKQLLHGTQQSGFEALVDILKTQKLAKWSLVTILPAYYAPNEEVFVKPTTVKGILSYFNIDDLVYHPNPTWEFYQVYRGLINQAKTKVRKTLSPSNAAFSGFLMMTVKI
jgi:hypothetical protein